MVMQVETPKAKTPTRRAGLGFYVFVGVLVALIAVGAIAWSIQIQNGLVVTNMRNIVSWGLYISLFAWFVGVSAGGLIVSSSAAVFKIKQWQPISKLSNLLASVAIALAALSILPDLGRPDRILNLFLSPNASSPLIWDVTIIFTYLAISLVELGLMLSADGARKTGDVNKSRSKEGLVRRLAFVALPVAILTHSITAWIFGLQISRPLWNTALLAPLFLASALVSGLGLVILVSVLSNRFGSVKVDKEEISGLARLLGVVILVDLFLLASEYITVVWPSSPTVLTPLLTQFFGPYWWLAWTQWTLAIVAFALVAIPKSRKSAPAQLVAALLVLLEVFFYRLELVVPGFVNPLVQYPPGTSLGTPSSYLTFQIAGSYFPSPIEWAIVLGILSTAALLITLGMHFLPLSGPEEK